MKSIIFAVIASLFVSGCLIERNGLGSYSVPILKMNKSTRVVVEKRRNVEVWRTVD